MIRLFSWEKLRSVLKFFQAYGQENMQELKSTDTTWATYSVNCDIVNMQVDGWVKVLLMKD